MIIKIWLTEILGREMRLFALSKISIGLSFLIAATSSFALIDCSDVDYGTNENYHSNMEILAKQARLPDDYYNRYHQDVVNYICEGDEDIIENTIDYGYVKRSEVESIRENLGLNKRSKFGESYEYSRIKFLDMNLSNAFSDNVANYYTLMPNSQCGQLSKSAIEGNPRSIAKLQSYPEYCIWDYGNTDEQILD